MADYLQAYTTQGRPPQPVPVNPTDRPTRERMGLPPHLEPYIEINGLPVPLDECAAMAAKLLVGRSTSEPPPSRVEEIPDVQVFEPTIDATEVGHKNKMQNIVCQHMYTKFQPEVRALVAYVIATNADLLPAQELRVRAYALGKKMVPEVASTYARLARSEYILILTCCAETSVETTEGELLSITAMPAFSGHSFEVRVGRY